MSNSTICSYGGCDAYGYCPCTENEPPDEDELQLHDDVAAGRALILGGRKRPVENLPPIDAYTCTRKP